MFTMGMKNKVAMAAAAVAGLVGFSANAVTINGAGASFPAPVYRAWTYSYKQATGNTINYQSVGSGAGIRQIKAKTVNFGASDSPLKKADLEKVGLVQFPMLMGGVVAVVNLPGIKSNQLRLSADVFADIFLGKITKWNDARIVADNPGVKLPDMSITVVHRSDGSGTTWIFTNYLSKISTAWKNGPGCGKAVRWPCGQGGQKNPGVALNVKKTKGAIGYVEYTYATEAKLSTVVLKNKDGNYVEPNMDSFSAAGANAEWSKAPGFYMVLTDQPGAKSWPITGVTYILIYKNQVDKTIGKEMLKYFSWCYKEGAGTATRMSYVPIPGSVVKIVNDMWSKDLNL